jgi:uncharacterized phage infection (PIP) family protein YhgE
MKKEPSNSDLLDAIVSLQGDVGLIKSDVGTLKSDVGTLKSDVGTLKTDVGTLKSDVGTLKSGFDTLNVEMGTLRSDVGTLKSGVGSLKEAVQGNSEAIAALQESVQGLATHMDERFETVERRVTRIEATMVTKDYLDIKLADQAVEFGGRIRKTEKRVGMLVGALVEEGSLSAKAEKALAGPIR